MSYDATLLSDQPAKLNNWGENETEVLVTSGTLKSSESPNDHHDDDDHDMMMMMIMIRDAKSWTTILH